MQHWKRTSSWLLNTCLFWISGRVQSEDVYHCVSDLFAFSCVGVILQKSDNNLYKCYGNKQTQLLVRPYRPSFLYFNISTPNSGDEAGILTRETGKNISG